MSGGQLVGFPPAILKHAWRDYPAILVYGPGNLPAAPFKQARVLGSLILVDTASHKTAGAVLVN